MGAAVARTFLRNGHPTTVWNRSANRADVLRADGATAALDPLDAVRAAGLVVVCVTDSPSSTDVLDNARAGLSGRAVVDLTSTTPEDARAGAARVGRAGAVHLSGAIMAVPPTIGTDRAEILYSGDRGALDAHHATLAELGTATWMGADPGAAALHDLALLGVMWSALGGYYQATALVGTEGVTATEFAPRAAGWLRTVAGFLAADAEEIEHGHYADSVSTLDVNAAGLELLRRTSERRDVPLGVAGVVRELVGTRIRAGHGADGLASLTEQFRPSSARRVA
jgi:3-hydroxyisobutyrate dehydrogenase-like beta-hydroxyacid dehydrogenase